MLGYLKKHLRSCNIQSCIHRGLEFTKNTQIFSARFQCRHSRFPNLLSKNSQHIKLILATKTTKPVVLNLHLLGSTPRGSKFGLHFGSKAMYAKGTSFLVARGPGIRSAKTFQQKHLSFIDDAISCPFLSILPHLHMSCLPFKIYSLPSFVTFFLVDMPHMPSTHSLPPGSVKGSLWPEQCHVVAKMFCR